MRRKLQILIVVWLLGLPLMAQSVEVLFDDSTTVDTTMHVVADTIVDSVLVQVADTIPAMDTVVQAAEPTPVMNDYYNWRDVRTVRDSLKHFMRTARRSLHSDISSMRDSVRQDLCEKARKHPHMIRIGWGDQMFETLVWYNQTHSTLYPESYIGQYEEQYRYTQHWFAEYQYRFRYWFSAGALVDYSGVIWDKVRRNGKGEELNRDKNCNFHNIAIMATARFTYLHSKYVSLYSGLGAGVNINTGSETDYRDRKTAVAPALSLTVLGMSVGNEQWFGAVEFGGLYSLMNIHEVYMAGSRMFTVSVGCRL